VVYATKYRHPAIIPDIRDRLYEYIGGIIRAKRGHLIEIGGVADHVHVLAQLSATFAFVPNTYSRISTMVDRCRRFTALCFRVSTFRGLTPTAICCHRFAIQPDRRLAIHTGEYLAIGPMKSFLTA
jgi:hypothetical protein